MRSIAWGVLAGLLLAAGAASARHAGAIDVGSTTVKLLVVDGRGRTVVDRQIRTRLGKGMAADRMLRDDARRRTVKGIGQLVRVAAGYGIAPGQLHLIATAAVRNTGNGPLFLEKDVKGRLGIARARILSGPEEAVIGYRGALLGRKPRPGQKFAVIDTGGGSHQIVVGQGTRILEEGSTQFGAHHVMETIHTGENGRPKNILGAADLARIDARMEQAVPRLPVGARHLAGATPLLSGGIARYLSDYFGAPRVTRAQIETLRARLTALPLAARVDVVRRDHRGRPLPARTIDALGLETVAGARAFGPDLPAGLTMILRLMTLLDRAGPGDTIELSASDARHVLVGR